MKWYTVQDRIPIRRYPSIRPVGLACLVALLLVCMACQPDHTTPPDDEPGIALKDTVVLSPADNVIEKLAIHPDSCLYLFRPGNYILTAGIVLYNRKEIVIRGHGARLIFNNPNSIFCIEIISELRNITIDGLEICAPDSAVANAQNMVAIGSWTSAINISQITISNCYFHTLNTGICIGTTPDGNYSQVVIDNNIIENISGFGSGRGYGIVNEFGCNVRITNNIILNTARHAIYQAKHQSDDLIIIENNYIENYDSVYTNPNYLAAQLVVARSNNVLVNENTIVNSRTFALSVEYDPNYCPENQVEGITLRHNHILNARRVGIWLASLTAKPLLDCNTITITATGQLLLLSDTPGYDTTYCAY